MSREQWAFPYILRKLYNWTLLWKLKLNALLYVQDNPGRLQWLTCWLVPPYVSMFSPAVCHQKLLQIVHREEVKVNYILHVKVEFFNSEKGPRDRCKFPHFTPFKKDAKKWRENRANLVFNVENRWFVLLEITSRFVSCTSKLEQKILWLLLVPT